MKQTLNTLTSFLSNACADSYVSVKDETILSLRDSLVKLAEDKETVYQVTLEDETDEEKQCVANMMLTKACNIASDIRLKAKNYTNVTIEESDLKFDNIAFAALNWINEER